MNDTMSRRAALSVFAASAVVLPFLPPKARSAEPTLNDLVDRHHRAYRRFSAVVRAYGDLEDKVRIPAARVAIGEMLDFTNNTRRVLSVGSYDELQDHASRVISSNVRAGWLSEKRAELRAAIRRQRYAEKRAGLTALDLKVRAASRAEEQARIALVLARPATAAEAARKRSYMARATPFREGWCDDSSTFLAAVLAGLGEVA